MYYIIEGELSGATEKTFGAKAPGAQARRRHWYKLRSESREFHVFSSLRWETALMSRSIRSVHALHRPISERYTVRGRGEYLRISPEDGLVVPRLSLLHYRSSLLDPRSSGRNKSHGTLLKMAQTNQLPVIPRTEDRGNENSRPEKDPVYCNGQQLRFMLICKLFNYNHKLYVRRPHEIL